MSKESVFANRIQQQIDNDRKRASEHGWAFKERTPDKHTIGDMIGAVLGIDNAADAAAFYASYVEWIAAQPDVHEKGAEYVAKANIGWCYGEGMPDERIAMWRKATGAVHPIFGAMETRPTPAEAFAAGVEHSKA